MVKIVAQTSYEKGQGFKFTECSIDLSILLWTRACIWIDGMFNLSGEIRVFNRLDRRLIY